MDIRQLIIAVRLLRKPQESAETKLREFFYRQDLFNTGELPLVEVREIFQSCIDSDDDKNEINKHFDEVFVDFLKRGTDTQKISLDDFEVALDAPRNSLIEAFDFQYQHILHLTGVAK